VTPAPMDPEGSVDARERVTVFAPFTGIWPHALSEAQLAQQLPEEQFDVTFLSCGKLFPRYCTVMELHRLPLIGEHRRKTVACRDCRAAAQLITPKLAPSASAACLADFAQPEDETLIEEHLLGVRRSDFIDFRFRGIEVGRLASYETLIKYKKVSLDLRDHEWDYYLESLRNCVRTLLAGDRFLNVQRPSTVLCYSPQYSVTGAFAAMAIQRDIRTYFVEGSANLAEKYSAVRVWNWDRYKLLNPALLHWGDGTAVEEPTLEEQRRIDAHFRTIGVGHAHDVYSRSPSGASTRATFGVEPQTPLLLLTMSSYDEVFSGAMIYGYPASRHTSDVYTDQADWVSDTIEWARAHPEVCLIVRLHPRDFPNRREGVKAEQAERWQALFDRLPINVKIDHPEDRYALGDHLDEIDVLITGWSSTALEALALGIPVITYDANLPRFPASIHITGRSRTDYMRNLDDCITFTRDSANRDAVFKWLAYSFCRGTIRVPGRVVDRNPHFAKKYARLAATALYRYVPGVIRPIDLRGTSDRPDAATLSALIATGADSVYDLSPTRDSRS
jgi:hypothetical protein